MKRGALAIGLAMVALGCGSSAPPSGATTSGGGGAASTSASTTSGIAGAGGAGGAAPAVDPKLFDCTATKAPARVSATPIACATDPTCTTKLVSGHRGAGGELGVIAPEDTLAAVRAAIVLGIDFVETDPRPTKDGVIVNMHDPSVDRTTDGTGNVDEMTYAEIQALHVRSEAPGDFACERVPTLEEVLLAAKGKVHVLVDANKTDRVDLLVDAIVKTGTIAWAIFDTSSVAKIDEALMIEPTLHTMIRVADAADLDAQMAHFAAHPPVIVEIDEASDAGVMSAAVHAAKNRAFRDVFVTDVGAGLSNDPSLYQSIFDLGVDIAQTDRPDLVLQTLGRWPPPPQP